MSHITALSKINNNFKLVSKKGMNWEDNDEKTFVFRSAILQVVKQPSAVSGKPNEFSIGCKVFMDNKENTINNEKLFKKLVETAQQKGVEFMLNDKNGKQFANKTFTNSSEIKLSKFWYDETFYLRFRSSVATRLLDIEKTKKNKENGSSDYEFNSINWESKFFNQGTLFYAILSPSAFYYKDTLYPFSLNVKQFDVLAFNENSSNEQNDRTMNKHGFLKEFALKLPEDLKLESFEENKDVPVNDVSSFNSSDFSFSKVLDGTKGPVIWSKYGKSLGPTYFRDTNNVLKFDCKPDPEYNSFSITLSENSNNQNLLNMVSELHSQLIDVVVEGSEKIYGEKHDRDTIKELISNPLYSNKDSDKKNKRVTLKFNCDDNRKPIFSLYLINNGKVEKCNMENSAETVEKYFTSGTVLKSVVFMSRVVIVNSQVYLTLKIEQVLLDASQSKIYTPALNGFAFSEFKNDHKTPVSKFNEITFSSYDEKRKEFTVYNGKSLYGILPLPIKVSFDIGLENNPEENKFPFRVKFSLNEENLEFIKNLDNKILQYCTENSKLIFGSQKAEKLVSAFYSSGKLEKFSKSDKDKKEPFCSLKAPVYNDTNIGFEAYRATYSSSKDQSMIIEKIELKTPEDLLQVFYKGSSVVPIINVKCSFIDKRIIATMKIAQVLLLPDTVRYDNPLSDENDDMLSLVSSKQTEFTKVQSDVKPVNKVVNEVVNKVVNKVKSDDEESESEESGTEEESDDE